MSNKVSIGVEAQIDTGAVAAKINQLGAKIAQANKVQYNPVNVKTADELNKIVKQFEQLRRVQGDLNKRMKQTGQGGSTLFDADWDKLYPDAHSRNRQMRKAFEYSVGPQFGASTQPAAPGRPQGGGGGGGGAGIGPRVVQAGLGATGPAGGVAAGALGTGMSAGFGAGLMGLMGGMLALGVSKMVGSVAEKIGEAQNNNIAMDRLKRTLGDVNVSFDALKSVVHNTGYGLKVTYDEAGKLATQFAKLGNISGDKMSSLGDELQTGVGMSRAFGLDPSQGMGVLGQMRGIGVTSNSQESRRFALLIGETIGKSNAFAKSEEVMDAIAGYATSQTRNNAGAANAGGFAGMFSALVGSGIPGLDPTGAGSMLGRVNASLSAGGAKGEASQFFTAMVGQKMGLSTLQTQVMREGGAFATNDGMFGKGSAYERYMGKTGPGGGATFLENTRSMLDQQYGGNSEDQKLLKAQAFANHSGLNMNQAMAMLSLKPNQMGGMEKYGKLENFNAAGIGNLSKVLYGSDGERQGVADNLMKRKDVTEKERGSIKAAMASGNVDLQKETLATLVASKDQEETQGKTARDQKATLDNIAVSIADKLVPAVDAMRAGIIFMAGKGTMSQSDIMKKVAELDSRDRQDTIKANSKTAVLGAIGESDEAGAKHKLALNYLKKNRSTMSPEEITAAQAEIAKLWREKAFKEEEVRKRILALEEEKEKLLKEEVGRLADKIKKISTDATAVSGAGAPMGGAPGAGGGAAPTTGTFSRGDRGGSSDGALGSDPGSRDEAMKFFMSKGWSREQAAGIVANLIQESGLKPGIHGDGGSAYGIAQWHAPRQKDFANHMGKNIKGSSFKEQMEFVHHELTAGKEKAAGDKLRASGSAGEAGAVVSKFYERPLRRGAEAASRASAAERILRIPSKIGTTALPDGYRPGDASMGGGRITVDDITVRHVGPDGRPVAANETVQTKFTPPSPYGALRTGGATGGF